MAAIVIPAVILLLVLAASVFATDSRDGRDWSPRTSDGFRPPVARHPRTS